MVLITKSAGLLLFRDAPAALEVLLAHPGGPFWAKKDDGAWTIPKGMFGDDEAPLDAARREFQEEVGCVPTGDFVPLGSFKQPSGKLLFVWAIEFDVDPSAVVSNTFEIEWPPRSGRRQRFPEVDRAGWFDIATAQRKILKGQAPILDRLIETLGATRRDDRVGP